jgi:BlaI family penicillinase repressor
MLQAEKGIIMKHNITDAELEIMRVLWRGGAAMTLAEIQAELSRAKDRNKSTVQTLVGRLRGKGVIEPLDKYGAARYVPLVTEDEYILAEGNSVIERFGSGKTLALALVRNGHLTDSDVEELRDYFKMGDDKSTGCKTGNNMNGGGKK